MIAYEIIKSISENSSEKCIILFHKIQNNQSKKNLHINKFRS